MYVEVVGGVEFEDGGWGKCEGEGVFELEEFFYGVVLDGFYFLVGVGVLVLVFEVDEGESLILVIVGEVEVYDVEYVFDVFGFIDEEVLFYFF